MIIQVFEKFYLLDIVMIMNKKELLYLLGGISVGAVVVAVTCVTIYYTVLRKKTTSTNFNQAAATLYDTINIAVINFSTVVSDSEITKAVAAVQKQVKNDFAPVWDINCTLHVYSKDAIQSIPEPYWECGIFDDADQANALG